VLRISKAVIEVMQTKKEMRFMKRNGSSSINKMAFLGAVAVLLMAQATVTINAQCGGTFDEMAASAFSSMKGERARLTSEMSARSQSLPISKGEFDEDEDGAIVGMWRTDFNITIPGVPDPVTIQTAFQIWNLGGTEVHNPKVDPRGGSLCLGAWKQSRGVYKLVHRVWSYAPDGTFLGTINLSEAVRVTNRGRSHTGSFTLDFFDPDGNPLAVPGPGGHPAHVEGVVVAERISPN
jgi:hypothetical protein